MWHLTGCSWLHLAWPTALLCRAHCLHLNRPTWSHLPRTHLVRLHVVGSSRHLVRSSRLHLSGAPRLHLIGAPRLHLTGSWSLHLSGLHL